MRRRVRGAHREVGVKPLDEAGYIRVVVHRAFHNLEPLRTKIFFNATQDLSGFLAVRSSGEDA